MTKVPINKVLVVDCDEEKDFFTRWVEYLRPKHNLTSTVQKFLAACLRMRYELSKSITDPTLLDETCLDTARREKLKQKLGLTNQQFFNILYKLKKEKILVPRYIPYSDRVDYYKISPSFIPNYEEGKEFVFMLIFKDGQNTQTSSEGIQSSDQFSEDALQRVDGSN